MGQHQVRFDRLAENLDPTWSNLHRYARSRVRDQVPHPNGNAWLSSRVISQFPGLHAGAGRRNGLCGHQGKPCE